MSDNIIPLKPQYALFNQTIRKNIAEGLKGTVQQGSEEKTVDRLEEVICTEIMRFFRSVFVKLAERAGESLGKKIVGS
jgi:hypothetical protein